MMDMSLEGWSKEVEFGGMWEELDKEVECRKRRV